MSLVEHAERELRAAGLFDEDSDYDGMLGPAALDIVRVFADQGHSGFSAALTTDIVTRLMRYEALTPITDDPDEWMHIADDVAGQPNLWQSTRQPDLFSHDGGRSWYSVDDPRWRQRIRGWRFRRKHRARTSGRSRQGGGR